MVFFLVANLSVFANDKLPSNIDAISSSPELSTTPASASADKTSEDWSNALHENISNSVYQSALWFDGFFAAEGNEKKPAKASAKIRLGWIPNKNDLFELETRFRLKVILPNLENRVDFILSDDSDDQLADLPLESVDEQQAFTNDSLTAAFRYVVRESDNKFTDTRIGVSSGDVFIRLRHKQQFSWQEKHGVKVEPAVFYFLDDGLGARLLLEYNYQLNPSDQIRLNYSIRASESFSGERWKTGIYYLQQLGDKKASALGFVSEGHFDEKRSNNFITNYKLSYRYRFNAYKHWLFFEIEPFMEWEKDENIVSNPGLALRIEGYFEKR